MKVVIANGAEKSSIRQEISPYNYKWPIARLDFSMVVFFGSFFELELYIFVLLDVS